MLLLNPNLCEQQSLRGETKSRVRSNAGSPRISLWMLQPARLRMRCVSAVPEVSGRGFYGESPVKDDTSGRFERLGGRMAAERGCLEEPRPWLLEAASAPFSPREEATRVPVLTPPADLESSRGRTRGLQGKQVLNP